MSISIIVPCYNEEASLPLLEERLGLALERLAEEDVEVLLIDDGSTDSTRAGLEAMSDSLRGARVVVHEENQGLGVALRTGMSASRGDVVVSLDSDCTYDPVEIPELISGLAEADVVLGSPYNPAGATADVPPHRLVLSKTLSNIYRLVLRRPDLYTFTSIFRAYRKQAALEATSSATDYLALAEMLVSLIDSGYEIVEYPTVLNVRANGDSKLRIVRMIRRHAAYVTKLAFTRTVPEPVAHEETAR
jgi:dolichol-phosphate mannosyltransferase